MTRNLEATTRCSRSARVSGVPFQFVRAWWQVEEELTPILCFCGLLVIRGNWPYTSVVALAQYLAVVLSAMLRLGGTGHYTGLVARLSEKARRMYFKRDEMTSHSWVGLLVREVNVFRAW